MCERGDQEVLEGSGDPDLLGVRVRVQPSPLNAVPLAGPFKLGFLAQCTTFSTHLNSIKQTIDFSVLNEIPSLRR